MKIVPIIAGTPFRKFISGLLALLIFILVFPTSVAAFVKILFFAVLGAIIGPFMGVTFPFPAHIKIFYITSLFISVAVIIFGVKEWKHTKGKITLSIGILIWILAGLMGLGTGT